MGKMSELSSELSELKTYGEKIITVTDTLKELFSDLRRGEEIIISIAGSLTSLFSSGDIEPEEKPAAKPAKKTPEDRTLRGFRFELHCKSFHHLPAAIIALVIVKVYRVFLYIFVTKNNNFDQWQIRKSRIGISQTQIRKQGVHRTDSPKK